MKYFALLLLFLANTLSAQPSFNVPKEYFGHWLLKSYADDLLKHKSAYKLQSKADLITEFIFSPSFKDSVMVNFNNVEGGIYALKEEENKELSCVVGEKGETYQFFIVKQPDSSKTLYCKGSNGSFRDYLFFDGTAKRFNAVQTFVHQQLFAGGYSKAIEMNTRLKNANEVAVHFKSNGFLEGIEGYDRYEILTVFDDIANFDIIKLYDSRKRNFVWKGWEMKGNRLTLYDLTDGEQYTYKKGVIFLQLDRKELE
jgi:hypothetical protein